MEAKKTTSRVFSVWCESQTSDLAFAVQTEQKDPADLEAQLGATSEALRTKIDGLARSGDPMPILKAASAIRINKQSPDIAGGVNVGNDDLDVGAGDQDITFGYSSDEIEEFMPLTHSMSTRLERN